MNALILDGSNPNDSTANLILKALCAHLPDAETLILREKKISNCAGDFLCWVRNPGMCNIDDDNRVIAARFIQSDLVISLTPVTFGGYSSELKHAWDHLIQNISPFFTRINGETHHKKRYSRCPDILIIGWMDEPDERAEAIFRHLVHRNSINLQSRAMLCGLIAGRKSETELTARSRQWLDALAAGKNPPAPSLPPTEITFAGSSPVSRAVLLVGSPRITKSTSQSLGTYLIGQLQAHGVETRTIPIYPSLNSKERERELLDTVDRADLTVLAFPLYVDSLPAPVTALLEKIAAYRRESSPGGFFSAIVNCGFPEAFQNETALAICAEFARRSGFSWMGGLSLGGGEGLIHGVPLNDIGRRATSLKTALTLTAEALANGKPVPNEAQDLFSKPIISAWLYRLIGSFSLKRQAKQFGMQKNLMRQPYLPENSQG
jgi:multimeric flavodoxin WrbA